MRTAQIAGLLVLCSALAACSGSGEAAEVAAAKSRVVDSSGGTVALGIPDLPYRPMAVGTNGAVAGTVVLAGGPRDSSVAVTRDQKVCGDSAMVTGASAGNVLVWVDSVTAGKPLPEVRRSEIAIEGCRFLPRVLGVIEGTTINVKSQDRVVLTSRFYREGSPEPVAEIHTVDAGQVVPSEQIARKAGIIEIRTAEQPWNRGYIAVFDHPYFTVADASGKFTIEGLPPGTYTVKAWHERMERPVQQRVVVNAGGSAQLDLQLTLR
jgi:hypothetical protein